MSGVLRIDRVVTSGTFSLDGGTWDVDNNVDNDACSAVPAAMSIAGRVVGDRRRARARLAHTLARSRCLLHPGDDMLWKATHPEERYWNLDAAQRIGVAGTEIEIIHTPGHSPGSVCLYLPEAGVLFSGDTLFNGGPGATGRSYSDFPKIVDAVAGRSVAWRWSSHTATTTTSPWRRSAASRRWIARGH